MEDRGDGQLNHRNPQICHLCGCAEGCCRLMMDCVMLSAAVLELLRAHEKTSCYDLRIFPAEQPWVLQKWNSSDLERESRGQPDEMKQHTCVAFQQPVTISDTMKV